MSASLDWPTPFTVGHHVYSDGARDANNRVVPVYTPPLDQPGAPVDVYGWETPKSLEPHERGHDARMTETVKLFAPPSFTPGPGDVIDIPDLAQFEVVGVPETAAGNPFGWNPGSTINLRKITG